MVKSLYMRPPVRSNRFGITITLIFKFLKFGAILLYEIIESTYYSLK